jgi:glycine cleavage system aminomethyltransferase T
MVRDEVGRHAHLARCQVELRKNEILVHEPEGGGIDPAVFGPMRRDLLAAFLAERADRARYSPVMKFAPADLGKSARYVVSRMTYRGEGGWMELSVGPLAQLAARFIPHLGRDSFYELC